MGLSDISAIESKKRNAMGRPRVVEPVLHKLKFIFLIGGTDEEACSYAGISTQVLYKYQKENPDFIEQKCAWKLNPIMKAKAVVFNNLDNVKVAMWFLERRAKEEFSTRYSAKSNENTKPNMLEFLELHKDELKST